VFNTLNEEHIKKITSIELNKLVERLKEIKYKISFDETIVDYLAKVGFDEIYGARPLKRAIQDKIEDLISEEVLTGNVLENKSYELKLQDEEIKLVKKSKTEKGI
jgi:ATP-dependent Clp protease ATP-binding subunit ClpA